MKPHPRIRKTIKWGGAVVTVLLVVVWVGSGWWFVAVANQSQQAVWVAGGTLSGQTSLYVSIDAPFEYARVGNPGPQWSFWQWGFFKHGPNAHWNLPLGTHFTVPLWPLVLLSTATTGFAWRLDTLARRRARLNLCPKCNYERTGLAIDAKCPECGASPVLPAPPVPETPAVRS